MMKLFPRICAVVLIVIGTTALCHAQTAYVSDMLILTLRQGPGPDYPVISSLKSDTPLTILEESKNYLKVKLSSGEQGWVHKNYVVTDPPKSIIIDQLKQENAALEDKIRALTEQAGQKDIALKTAATGVDDILKENKRLKTRNAFLSATLAQQKENNAFIFKTGIIKWFLAGVGVLLLGWMTGRSISSRQGGSGSLLD